MNCIIAVYAAVCACHPSPPDAGRILEMQSTQAMEVRRQHREVPAAQPVSHLTPEEEKLHRATKAPK